MTARPAVRMLAPSGAASLCAIKAGQGQVRHLDSLSARMTRWVNRVHARWAGMARPVTAFRGQSEPRSMGSPLRGARLIAGQFQFAGHLVEAPGRSIWRIAAPSRAFAQEIHGFGWLDDLAAADDRAGPVLARQWVGEWIALYGRGRGPGWWPDLTGRRLTRWVNHAELIAPDAGTMARQVIYLARRWDKAPAGLPRIEALAGLIHAALVLEGMDAHIAPAQKALGAECGHHIDADGAIPTRNPEELLDIFALLNWTASALSEAGRMATRDHLETIARIAPVLRALRHSDGGLARFHGGGRGAEGRLDHALAASGIKTRPGPGLHMGYARLNAGRTTIIMDAAPPPARDVSFEAHASTLAFELTSGRRPVIVNCGAGRSFGGEWRRAGRATPSHSTLGIEGVSSARLARARASAHGRERLDHAPGEVQLEHRLAEDAVGIIAAHDGYFASHGLIHIRQIDLSTDGRDITGEDTLAALEPAGEQRFTAARLAAGLAGVAFKIRFHLHPDVRAEQLPGDGGITMTLRSGEVWVFRHDGRGRLGLAPSVYLQRDGPRPRPSQQVVLSGHVSDYAARLRWTLAKAHDTPTTTRDLEPDERELLT